MDRASAAQVGRRIRQLLETRRIGRTLIVEDSLTSTMAFARRWREQGAAAGSVVLALEQSAGRRRGGRFCVSPRGVLSLSLSLAPLDPAELSSRAGFAAAVAASRTITMLGGPRLAFDWPNDLVLEHAGKVGGVLLELLTPPGERPSLLLGVGLNLGPDPRAVDPGRAGSAAAIPLLALDDPLPRVTAALLACLEQELLRLERPVGWRELLREVRELSLATQQREVRIRRPGGEVVKGTSAGIDEDGSLLLRTSGQGLIAVRYGQREP